MNILKLSLETPRYNPPCNMDGLDKGTSGKRPFTNVSLSL